MPANDRGGNLIAHGVAEHRGVASRGGNAPSYPPSDLPRQRLLIEERDVLLPRDSHEDLEAVLPSAVEKPHRRDGIGSKSVDPAGGHLTEVAIDDLLLRIQETVPTGPERAIRNPAYVELLIAYVKELAPHDRALGRIALLNGRGGGEVRFGNWPGSFVHLHIELRLARRQLGASHPDSGVGIQDIARSHSRIRLS